MTAELEPYPAYKDSGVEWLGKVPAHWEVRRLRTIAEMRVSNVDKHSRDGERPIRLCNYVDVYRADRIRVEMPLMAATAAPEEIEKFRLRPGDVLITKDSEAWNDIGVPALVEEAADDTICGYHLALLRPFSGCVSGGFLFRAVESSAVAYQFHIHANGVTRYGLTRNAIKSAWVPLPPLPEQAAIVRFLDHADQRIQCYIRTKEKLSGAASRADQSKSLIGEYRTRLIGDVVTGKLDVREVAAGLPRVDSLAAEGDSVEGLDLEGQSGRAAWRPATEESGPSADAVGADIAEAKLPELMPEEVKRMDWETCSAVERNPGKISGAWAFTGTRVPVYALFENLAGGATIDEFVEWFPDVDKRQVQAVLEHEAKALKNALAD